MFLSVGKSQFNSIFWLMILTCNLKCSENSMRTRSRVCECCKKNLTSLGNVLRFRWSFVSSVRIRFAVVICGSIIPLTACDNKKEFFRKVAEFFF